MDEFFSYVSKGVIIIPIVIIVLSLLIKFNQNNQPSSKTMTVISPTITATPTIINKINIDLNGP